MGKGTLAIRVAGWFLNNSDYTLVGVVPVIPEPTWTDSLLSWAKDNNIPVIESGDYKDINVAEERWRADLIFSVFYDKIFKDWFISQYEYILNLHNGPLPKYRGVSPINWALKNNERKHGVTIHQIVPGIDEGPIVAQLDYSIYPEFDEVVDVYNRALEYGWVLFTQTMPIFEKIRPQPQDNSVATYYNAAQNRLLVERRYFTKQESINRYVLEEQEPLQEYADRLSKYRER